MKKETLPKEKKSTAKLISYAIKAVIPTGPYANIQPEIHVNAGTIEEAAAFVIPHLDELFEKYLNISERPKPRVTVKETLPPVTKPVEVPKEVLTTLTTDTPEVKVKEETFTPGVTINEGGKLPPTIEELQATAQATAQATVQAPVQEEQPVYPPIDSPMGKAKLAVESCKSIEALNLINVRIQESVKLDALDKADLTVIVNEKRKQLLK